MRWIVNSRCGLLVSVGIVFALGTFGVQARSLAQQTKAPIVQPRAGEPSPPQPKVGQPPVAQPPGPTAGKNPAGNTKVAPAPAGKSVAVQQPLQEPKVVVPTSTIPSADPTALAPSAEQPFPAGNMPREPSIYETGRVGKMGVSDSGAKIKHTPDGAKPKETRVDDKSSVSEQRAATVQPGGVLNQALLNRELQSRLGLLKDCRVEVARQKHVQPAAVAASRVILRWIILPNGKVTDTQVVATSPADGNVVNCVKRQMSLWSFSPPTGGPASVERPFKFH
ncbi:MAG: AgmX/PglI C-terminal domain-containing protein [Deltaproteobacteria bacterium]|nr:AgmX/PglI C-terminal domain-containing protein [Deltaproteobacteria bacterium]